MEMEEIQFRKAVVRLANYYPLSFPQCLVCRLEHFTYSNTFPFALFLRPLERKCLLCYYILFYHHTNYTVKNSIRCIYTAALRTFECSSQTRNETNRPRGALGAYNRRVRDLRNIIEKSDLSYGLFFLELSGPERKISCRNPTRR